MTSDQEWRPPSFVRSLAVCAARDDTQVQRSAFWRRGLTGHLFPSYEKNLQDFSRGIRHLVRLGW